LCEELQQLLFVSCRLKTIDECVEKFLEDFNEQVQKLSADEFDKFVSCVYSCDVMS